MIKPKQFKYNKNYNIVLNRINANPFLCNEPLELKEFINNFTKENRLDDIFILDTIIYDRIDYKRSITKGLGVCELDSNNKCNIEFNNLFEELKEKMN